LLGGGKLPDIQYKKIPEENYRPFLSVVIPVYKCDQCLNELFQRLSSTLQQIDEKYEIILVNDASPSNDWAAIKALADYDSRIHGINLSRNFGQYKAITAGLDYSSGEWVVIMDCDLQDQPEEIVKLFDKAKEGYDFVVGKRSRRKDKLVKRVSSKLFYKFFGYMTDSIQDESISQFGIYHRKVIDSVLKMREKLKFFPTMVRWVGFNSTTINVEHATRRNGKSSYSYRKLFSLAVDVIIAFSDKPLRIIIQLGLLIAVISFGYAFYIFYGAIFGERSIEGWASLIVSIWFLSGITIFILGIIGTYLCRIFDEVKNRPVYIIDEVYKKEIECERHQIHN